MESWPEVRAGRADVALQTMPGLLKRDLTAEDNWTQHLRAWSEHLSDYFSDLKNNVVLKPPLRFRDTRPVYWTETKYDEAAKMSEDENERKVVVILQNILRNLEKEIEQDRRNLKVYLTFNTPDLNFGILYLRSCH